MEIEKLTVSSTNCIFKMKFADLYVEAKEIVVCKSRISESSSVG